MKLIWKILITLAIVIVLMITGFSVWAYTPASPMAEAIEAIQSDTNVNVSTDGWVTFSPSTSVPETGVILYPGGRVNYQAYAPIAHKLAAQGFLVALVPMPFNLAVFGSEKADQVIAANPEITNWVIGGHSLGGAMAASYVYNNPGAVDGLVLLAAYPANSQSLANSDVKVLSISGTLDGLATPEKISASAPLLPKNTLFEFIKGGDHAQFGWYGPQAGDNSAEISREEQQNIILEQIIAFLDSLKQ
jgi:dienelactone hydrolase